MFSVVLNGVLDIQLFDMTGRQILQRFTQQTLSTRQSFSIGQNRQQSGTYLVTVSGYGTVMSNTVIVH